MLLTTDDSRQQHTVGRVILGNQDGQTVWHGRPD
jgi:hypothetical protein